jgi:hypothetical protein
MNFGTDRYQWEYDTALASGANVIVQLGRGGARDFIDGRTILWLTWGIISELTFTFTVEGSLYPNFPVPRVLATQACLAATFYTPYQLPLPLTGPRIIVNMPFVRIHLVDTAVADHAYTEIYVKGWWE